MFGLKVRLLGPAARVIDQHYRLVNKRTWRSGVRVAFKLSVQLPNLQLRFEQLLRRCEFELC